MSITNWTRDRRGRPREGPALGAVWRAIACAVLALSAVTVPGTAAGQDAVRSPFADSMRQLAGASDRTRGTPALERALFARLYDVPTARVLWSWDGQPTQQALRVLDALDGADTYGLRPDDYDVDTLRVRIGALRGTTTPRIDILRFDASLSRAVVQLLVDLHHGRVDPRSLGFAIPHASEALDLASVALSVSRAADVAAAIGAAAPIYGGYAGLVRALARYRVLAADTTLRLPRAATPIRPGDPYADVAALERLLIALGDLSTAEHVAGPTMSAAADDRYAGAVVAAVAAFQRRHGLEPDSIIGPATLAQLRAPLAQRVRQIELALERWRWLPDRPPQRYVVVNIPAFRLYAFENDSIADQPALGMKVIVGQAQGRHATPMFTGELREVVFRPYWDVPPRIARTELVPIIRRRPEYLDREALEIVGRGESGERGVLPPTPANLAGVAAGTLRLRQRPGPNNSLGLVKFVFPNDYNVYLHGTPAQHLFANARRDFSHGCIRVEQPEALAQFVLRGQAGWDPPGIDAAMHGSRTIHVRVTRPLTVYVLYATAVARGTTIYFYPDLYGRDAMLAAALGESGAPARR
jgi:L,D-transpeptidase YcbB